MSKRAFGGTLAAFLILAAIVGFAGGAYLGTQSGDDDPGSSPTEAAPTDGSDDNSEDPDGEDGDAPDEEAEETPPSDSGLTLTFAESSIGAGERLDYEGSIEPAEEGVSLRMERSVDGGDWETFPVNPTTRDDGTFSGYLNTSQAGENAFRVVRTDDESVVSAEQVITVN